MGDTAIFRKLLGEWSKTEFQSSAGDGFHGGIRIPWPTDIGGFL